MTTKRIRGAPPSSPSPAGESLSDLATCQGTTLNAATQATQTYFSGVAAVNQEIPNFIQTRLRHDIELGESLARCRTWSDATKAQGNWLKEAAEDYSTEAQNLFELGSSLMRESWAPIEQSMARPGKFAQQARDKGIGSLRQASRKAIPLR